MAKTSTNKSPSRKQRRRRREQQQSRVVEARVVEPDDSTEPAEPQQPVEPPAEPVPARSEDAPTSAGLMERLFGSGGREADDRTGLATYNSKPGLLRPLARRDYQREAALSSIRRGFDDLSDLMADIRDGLHDSVDRQGDLLEQLKYLPVVAEQNAKSAERFEEQFKRNNDELAKSNELSGENLRVQTEALRQQADSVKALRDQILGQRDQSERLDKLLGGMGKESRDQKRDLDDLQGRLDRARQSDQAIADNLNTVAAAIKHVSDQSATQGAVVAKLQAALDERSRRLEAEVDKRSRSQGWLLMLALLLAFVSLGAVAAVGVLYLRSQGQL